MVAFLLATEMFIFTKRFSVTPTHATSTTHSAQLVGITPTDDRVKGLCPDLAISALTHKVLRGAPPVAVHHGDTRPVAQAVAPAQFADATPDGPTCAAKLIAHKPRGLAAFQATSSTSTARSGWLPR